MRENLKYWIFIISGFLNYYKYIDRSPWQISMLVKASHPEAADALMKSEAWEEAKWTGLWRQDSQICLIPTW